MDGAIGAWVVCLFIGVAKIEKPTNLGDDEETRRLS